MKRNIQNSSQVIHQPQALTFWIDDVELFIHNIIKKIEAWTMKQLASNPLKSTLKQTYLLYWSCGNCWFTISSTNWSIKTLKVHKVSINNKHWSKLTSCINDVWIVDSQYRQRKWSMKHETAHKLPINNNHQSKLTRCIDGVWIVDSQYHQRKWSMIYETDEKSPINQRTLK